MNMATSCRPCGCDPGANHQCQMHKDRATLEMIPNGGNETLITRLIAPSSSLVAPVASAPFCGPKLGRPGELNQASIPTADPRPKPAEGAVQKFATGASRDADHDKHDYEGFLCPLVLDAYGAYMHRNRLMADGSQRESDNWQKGIPLPKYMKSLWRHFKQVWMIHRGYVCEDERGNRITIEDALCGVLFNTMGYLHEHLKGKTTR